MIQIVIPAAEQWDESKQEFINTKEQILCLEHSLVSLSKWESKWEKPFLSKKEKTHEETIDYIKCMTINQVTDPDVYLHLTRDNIEQINRYIQAPMTATYISENRNGKSNNEQITAELIYYWMISLNIPFECQNWHLNRLIMLIKVCNIKNQPPKKRNKREIMSQNAALNEVRRKQLNTKG